MPTSIAREEVQRLIRDEEALLIEVLPTAEYRDEHIDGAINIPLKTLDRESTGSLDKSRPLIVYCHDAM
jgi:rhodanese-related sulfurtransferase